MSVIYMRPMVHVDYTADRLIVSVSWSCKPFGKGPFVWLNETNYGDWTNYYLCKYMLISMHIYMYILKY